MVKRHYTIIDRMCFNIDHALRTLSGKIETTGRPYPATSEESQLTQPEQRHAAGLMRVNHAGEIAAQALYQGQALVSRDKAIAAQLEEAASEEGDHLAWCQQRLMELGSHPSYLNPVWYTGSFVIGVITGWMGDKWSLGFVAETEKQVVEHLERHLEKLPLNDKKSARIIEQMQQDEATHRRTAIDAGALFLPVMVKKIMQWTSGIMVKTAYWV